MQNQHYTHAMSSINVNFIPGDSTGFHLRKGVLEDNTLIEKGKYFSATDLQKTYNNFSRLGCSTLYGTSILGKFLAMIVW